MLRRERAAVVVFSVLYLLWAVADMGISRSRRVLAILLAGPCEKAEHEAEKEAFPAEKAMIT